MRPITLDITNILGIKSSSIDFCKDPIVAIVGENGAGKSCIVDSILIALFGSPSEARSVGNGDFIHTGENSGTVSFVFERENQTYKVTRDFKKRKKTVSHKALLVCKKDEEWEPVSSGASSVTEMVASLLCPWENTTVVGTDLVKRVKKAFTTASLVPQGHITDILDDKPSDRWALISAVLGLDGIDDLKAKAKEINSMAKNERLDLEITLKEVRKSIDEYLPLGEYVLSLNQYKKDKKTHNTNIEFWSAKKDFAKDRDNLVQKLAKINDDIENLTQDIKLAKDNVILSGIKKTYSKYIDKKNALAAAEDKCSFYVSEIDSRAAEAEVLTEKLAVAKEEYRKEVLKEKSLSKQIESQKILVNLLDSRQDLSVKIETLNNKKELLLKADKSRSLKALHNKKTAMELSLQMDILKIKSLEESLGKDTERQRNIETNISELYKKEEELSDTLKNLSKTISLTVPAHKAKFLEEEITNIENRLGKLTPSLEKGEALLSGVLYNKTLGELERLKSEVKSCQKELSLLESDIVPRLGNAIRTWLSSLSRDGKSVLLTDFTDETILSMPTSEGHIFSIKEDQENLHNKIKEKKALIDDLEVRLSSYTPGETTQISEEEIRAKLLKGYSNKDNLQERLVELGKTLQTLREQYPFLPNCDDIDKAQEKEKTLKREILECRSKKEELIDLGRKNESQIWQNNVSKKSFEKTLAQDRESFKELNELWEKATADMPETTITELLAMETPSEEETLDMVVARLEDNKANLSKIDEQLGVRDTDKIRSDYYNLLKEMDSIDTESLNQLIVTTEKAKMEIEDKLKEFHFHLNLSRKELEDMKVTFKDAKVEWETLAREKPVELIEKGKLYDGVFISEDLLLEKQGQLTSKTGQKENAEKELATIKKHLEPNKDKSIGYFDGQIKSEEYSLRACLSEIAKMESQMENLNKLISREKDLSISLENKEIGWRRASLLSCALDGSKFQNFVLDYTLQSLLEPVNKGLEPFVDFSVETSEGNIVIKDKNDVRSCNSLSGGEKTLVSLLYMEQLRKLASFDKMFFVDEGLAMLDTGKIDGVVSVLHKMDGFVGLVTHDRDVADIFPAKWEIVDGDVRQSDFGFSKEI